MRSDWLSIVCVVVIAAGAGGLLLLLLRDVLSWFLGSGHWSRALSSAVLVLTGLALLLGPGATFFLAPIVVIVLLLGFQPQERNSRTAQVGILMELAAALEQGIPLDEFAQALAGDSGSEVAVCLKRLAERLRQGVAFSAALREAKLVPEHTVLAIQAGEVGGGRPIPNVLRRAADELRAQSALRSSIVFWVCYSIIVGLICGGVALFHMVFILPKFQDIFRIMGGTLPLPTRLLLSLMHSADRFGLATLCVLVGVRVLAIPLNSPLRRAARWVLAFLPLFGARLRHRALARAARALEALAESGLTLPEMCRAIAVPALAGPYARSFAKLAGQTEKGQPLSEALPATVLPASFAWFMRAGTAGDFARAMRAAAEYHDARTERLDLLLAMLLPCVVMSSAGLLVASFYLSVLLPIFKMQELVRKH